MTKNTMPVLHFAPSPTCATVCHCHCLCNTGQHWSHLCTFVHTRHTASCTCLACAHSTTCTQVSAQLLQCHLVAPLRQQRVRRLPTLQAACLTRRHHGLCAGVRPHTSTHTDTPHQYRISYFPGLPVRTVHTHHIGICVHVSWVSVPVCPHTTTRTDTPHQHRIMYLSSLLYCHTH